jgi:hypothetical protein
VGFHRIDGPTLFPDSASSSVNRHRHCSEETAMSINLIILIVVLVLLFGGGGGYYLRRNRG